MKRGYIWLANWYATRLHAVPQEEIPTQPHETTKALCGTHVFKEPPTNWAKRRVKAGKAPKCKHCTNILEKR